jgi:protein-S-isoprenylcysteine O-methyltransferase Ste14
MKWLKKIVLLPVALLNAAGVFAQDKVEMADVMRSNGKIYIVVTICLTVLVGLFFYVFMLDRKISRFEKSSKD